MISPRSRSVNRRGCAPRNLKVLLVAGLRIREAVTDSMPVIGEASMHASKKTDAKPLDTALAADGTDCLPVDYERSNAVV
ncbi:MAG: hypothetical protein IAG10_21585, partial [Planctomycetaceae bacterium]|nr:hypothetical protein [Planctomycetaceae bacterium]